jgi:hypothetical protein
MGVVLLLAAAPIAHLAERRERASRLAAGVLAVLMLVEPARASWRYVAPLARPSAEDKAVDWLEANASPDARILETRLEANPGARPGCALGVDRARFVFLERTRLADRADLPLLVPEMDYVVTTEGRGQAWAPMLEPLFRPRGPGCGVGLLIQRPLESARPRYVALDLSQATLAASENTAALPALFDGRRDTLWSAAGRSTTSGWLEIALPRAVRLGDLVLEYPEGSEGKGSSMRVLAAENGRDFRPVRRVVEVTPSLARQLESRRLGASRPLEKRFVLRDRFSIRTLRIEWSSSGPEPLSLCELGLGTLEGPDGPE